jgi:hypothetical protein
MEDAKVTQSIAFGEIAPQQLRDGFLPLEATASSGLPVFFVSGDTSIAVVEGDAVRFLKAGATTITACQPGNERYYEAPQVTRQLLIRDWNPNKKTQTVQFELPNEWRLSKDGTIVSLSATASSGLPVTYTLSATSYGFLSANGRYLYLYHAGEGGVAAEAYNAHISVTASQPGDEEYNPADNVTEVIHVIGDVFH